MNDTPKTEVNLNRDRETKNKVLFSNSSGDSFYLPKTQDKTLGSPLAITLTVTPA